MTSEFDPYLQWLGIRDPERPPNHYRLLGIELFESDLDVIANSADRQMAHVRTFQTGKNSELSQQILNELSAAKICLLDPAAKTTYDAALQESVPVHSPPANDVKMETAPGPQIEIKTDEDGFQLQRPKRGHRGALRRFLLPSIGGVLILGLVGIVAWQMGWFQSTAVSDQSKESSIEKGEAQDPSTEQGENGRVVNQSEATDNDPAQQDTITDDVSEAESISPMDPKAETTKNDSDLTVDTPPIQEESKPKVAPWDMPKAPSRTFQITNTASPVAGFGLSLANRNVDTARIMLRTTMANAPSVTAEQIDTFKMLLLSHEQFWRSVRNSLSQLQPSFTFVYRDQLVAVINISSTTLQLQSINAKRKSFSLEREVMDTDLAMALVEYQHRNQKPVAWRQIGCFLCIDRKGSIADGLRYLKLARQHGMTIVALQDGLRNLNAFVNPKKFSAIDSDLLDPLPRIKRSRVPGSATLRVAARQLSDKYQVAINTRTPKGRTDTIKALNQVLEENPELDLNLKYFALDQIRRNAFRNGNIRSALSVIVQICSNYEHELDALILETKEIKNAVPFDRHELTSASIEIAYQQIQLGEFEMAKSILDFAIADARDQLLDRQKLQTVLGHYDQALELFREAESSMRILKKSPKDPVANQKIGEFLCFVRLQFRTGLPYLIRGTDAQLRPLAMNDMLTNPAARPNANLATAWQSLAEENEGLIRRSILHRAIYWSTAKSKNET